MILWFKYEVVHGKTCSVGVCGSDSHDESAVCLPPLDPVDEQACGKGNCKEPEFVTYKDH